MKKVITISREYGSGGRAIGQKLAERLGIKCYDKEFIAKMVEDTGLDPKFVEENAEYAPGNSFFSYLGSAMSNPASVNNSMSLYDYLYATQVKIIEKLADEEECIIVGRSADYILRHHDNVLNVFIYASSEFRQDFAVVNYGEDPNTIKEKVKERDKKRAVNYEHFTGRKWGVLHNYDLCLDSSKLGIDKCVEIIAKLKEEL